MDSTILARGLAALLLAAVLGSSLQAAGDRLPDDLFAASPDVLSKRSQDRLQKIRQLTFDRRPSSVLKAWSTPEGASETKQSNGEATDEGGQIVPGIDSEPVVEKATLAAPMMHLLTGRAISSSGAIVVQQQTVASGSASIPLILEEAEPGSTEPGTPTASVEAVSPSEHKDDKGQSGAERKSEFVSTYRAADFDAFLKAFQRKVTLGDWSAVGDDLAILPQTEKKALYQRLLEALPAISHNQMMPPQQVPLMPQFMERNTFSTADVVALATLAPMQLDDPLLSSLGRILSLALEQGHSVEDFVSRAQKEAAKPEQETSLHRRQAAKVLFAASRPVEAGVFLPTVEEAQKADDREALNLLSRHYLALYAKDPKAGHLERAWAVNQAVLAVGKVSDEAKAEALQRAVELAPKVDEALGRAWLLESFTRRPERGMEVIAAIGKDSARGLQTYPMQPDRRSKLLALQKTAVEALLDAAPDRAVEWSDGLAMLAVGWMNEAEFSRQFDASTSLGPRMQRDAYGNIFYMNPADPESQQMMMMQQNGMPRPIPTGEILEHRPSQGWLDHLPQALSPRLATLSAQLLLKVGEDNQAFPYIEQLATTHPEQARQLAEEFLRVWTKNHNPNAQRDYTNPYMFMYGFERRSESIPLTRSKQERNLKELASWVDRLRKLPIKQPDERLLARAFTQSHSVAEVYRLDAIESVFGPIGDVDPDTLAELVQQMRANLVSVWRQPAVQEQSKTKRREKDIRVEVLRGYQVARSVLDDALARHPDQWKLVLARAALLHDENNYKHEAELSTDFAPTRKQAMALFRQAAELYAKQLNSLDEQEQTAEVYQVWYYASLGASDLNAIEPQHVADRAQPPLIKAAIDSLPGESAERHRTIFANDLFTRMSNVSPAVKMAYVEGGFQIVGDHPRAREAKQIHDYYKDLNSELKLTARLDGSDQVGHQEPFGLFVELRHTPEIEREAGGFRRYLQNQNQGGYFYYNYGRPLENYRDKFEEAARKALEEQFQVLSVTFQSEDVNSKATNDHGWRVTPYAYLLLKAKGPQVDRIPPLRLDLDFLDTSGYVILPIETPALPIDAKAEKGTPRPVENLKLVQTLDERQAAEGKLVLEVKATGRGLVPDLAGLLDIQPDGLEVASVEDQGLSISRFDPDSDQTAVESERNWLVSLRADPGARIQPATFRFPRPKVDVLESTYQRYVDADLEEVPAEVALEGSYKKPSYRAWLPWAIGLPALFGLLSVAWWRLRSRPVTTSSEAFRIPDPLTPFTVLGLLREIELRDGLNPDQKRELAGTISSLEQHYFDHPTGTEPNLRDIAESWVGRACC